jgi:D-threo-aldose 1-dehydrogenase
MIRSEAVLPRIGLGTAAIAGLFKPVSAEEAIDTLQAAWENGVRYFDTAPHYGQGRAERRLGDFLRDKPIGSYVLSTKVGRLLRPASQYHTELNKFQLPLPFDQHFDYSYDGVMRSVQDSYQRLGLNRLDVLFIHDIGARTHGPNNEAYVRQLREGGWRALDELRRTGVVSAIGLGVNEVEICEALLDDFDLDCILLAGRYTMLDRSAERALLDRCAQKGVKLVIGGVFNSGILATGPRPGAHWDYGEAPEPVLRKVAMMQDICRQAGTTLAEAALNFPFRHQNVETVLLGNSDPTLLKRNLTALQHFAVDEHFWIEIDKVASS